MLSLSCLTNRRQQSHLHLNLKSSVSLKLPAMILATILFVFFTGSAVLADDKCEPENKFTFSVPFMAVPDNYVYCATRVTGQNKQLCGLKFVTRPTLFNSTVVLNGTYYDESGTRGFYTFDLKTEAKGLGAKYPTTIVPSIEGQKVTTYVTQMALLCMTYVKCFQGGPFAGTEDSGTFTAVVCPTKQDCKDSLTGARLIEALNSTAGPELMYPDWYKCPK